MANKLSTIRKFIDRNVERCLVREFLLSKTERAGFGALDFQRTPEGTKVTLHAERVGMVIGRKGKIINELQRRLQNDFNLNNPRLEVAEIDTPALNAQVMASKLASALERGWYFRRAGHSTLLNVMEAGARGCLVVLSGKLTGSRNRTQKFQAGHIKYCGDTALQFMEIGFGTCVKKLGTIGCTVAIMRPGSKLPHEIRIKDRHEVGLSPLASVAIVAEDSDELPEPIVEDAPVDEIIEQIIEDAPAEEAPAEEAPAEEAPAEEAPAEEAPAEEAPAEEAPAEEAPAEEAPAEEAPAEEAPAEEAPAEEAPAEEAPAEEAPAEEAPAEEAPAEEAPAEEAPAEAATEDETEEASE